ncbi:uncharacterized protein CEXT_352841 [Caerostris extrusa]|uniref:Major facilitator superfamily (MFS) profile domain-containing protein n=1 Tax=Caerostris extrusa TaxID=172846 RepID=A0AAV4MGP4_CAEEX|nr:uncharacterized protein CEXT_352841 [Caerostris extrusa]
MKFPEILAMCPNENKNVVLKTAMELKRLYNTIYRLDLSENGLMSVVRARQTDLQNEDIASTRISFGGRLRNIFKSFWFPLMSMFSLYGKSIFLLICISRLVHFMTFAPVLTTVEDFLVEKGLSKHEGQYAVIALSIGDLLGRLALGWVTDYGFLSLPRFMLFTMVLQSISTVTLPFMNTRLSIFVALSVFGMFQGSLYVRHPVLVSKYIEKHDQSVGMGCLSFFAGIVGLGMAKYIGFFKDEIGYYDNMFYISGSIGALVGLLWIFEPYFRSEQIEDKEDETV